MDLETLFFTPIDELYDAGLLPEPEPEHNVKMVTLTYKCTLCKDEYTDTYRRVCNPEKRSRGMVCIHCQTPTMFLHQAIPHTIEYMGRGFSCGSFVDDVSHECWECGAAEHIIPLVLSNGQEIKLCSSHFKAYATEVAKTNNRKKEQEHA